MAEVAATPVSLEPAATAATTRFGWKEKTLYSVGDIADGMKNTAIGTFVLFYLNGVLGMSGTAATLASSLALLVDAVLDPLIGYASDNTKSKWGRRHPWMLGAAIPFFLGMGLLFSIPDLGSFWGTFAYAMAVLILVRVAYSVFLLPYAAFGAEITRDYTERSTVMTLRTFFNIVGVIICQFLGYGVFFAQSAGGVGNHAAYAPFGWTCAGIVLVALLISWGSSLRLRHLAYEVAPASQSATARLLREFGEVMRNRSFVILFITVLTFWISQGAAAVLFNHTFKFFWAMEETTIGYIAVSGTIGAAIGIPICGVLLQFFEKRDVSAVGLGAFCLCQFLPATLQILGVMPEGGWLVAVMCGVYFIIGIVAASVGIAFGSMMMDAADEHELLFGSRREGLYFAGLIFSAKAAIAGGLVFAGIGLDLIGFPAGIANTPGMTIAPDTARNLGIMSGPAAAILSFTSVMALMRYQLLKAKLTSIQKDLADRRAAKASA